MYDESKNNGLLFSCNKTECKHIIDDNNINYDL